MNIFTSGWLQRMVNKAGKTPVSRIQSLFQILHDWIEVPEVRSQIQEVSLDKAGWHALRAYLLQLVDATGVTNPDMVAGQIHMILLGAINEEIRNPGSQAIEHGGQAAILLVNAQLPIKKMTQHKFAVAASVLLVAGLLTLLLAHLQTTQVSAQQMQVEAAVSIAPSPDQVATLYHLHDQTHAMNCSYPQALMLAPELRAPYIENIVNGDIGEIQPEAIAKVSKLYQKVDCYYPSSINKGLRNG